MPFVPPLPALLPLSAEDLFVTPGGTLSLASLALSDDAPALVGGGSGGGDGLGTTGAELALHGGAGGAVAGAGARFAPRALVSELLAVLGPGRAARAALIARCADALCALRDRPDALLGLLAAALPLCLPGASAPRDLAGVRARLLLLLPQTQTQAQQSVGGEAAVVRAAFAERVARFLGE